MSSEQRTGVLDDLRKFVETTSLRGVSRIFKSSNRVLQILWALAVAFCAAMMVFQLSRVIRQYLRYEFSTVTKEDIWSHTVRQSVIAVSDEQMLTKKFVTSSLPYSNITCRKKTGPVRLIFLETQCSYS